MWPRDISGVKRQTFLLLSLSPRSKRNHEKPQRLPDGGGGGLGTPRVPRVTSGRTCGSPDPASDTCLVPQILEVLGEKTTGKASPAALRECRGRRRGRSQDGVAVVTCCSWPHPGLETTGTAMCRPERLTLHADCTRAVGQWPRPRGPPLSQPCGCRPLGVSSPGRAGWPAGQRLSHGLWGRSVPRGLAGGEGVVPRGGGGACDDASVCAYLCV